MIDRTKRHFFPVLPCALAVLCTLSWSVEAAEEVQVGRYSSMRPLPTEEQINLLSALVTVRFPETVATVGQAVDQLLGPSGYRLAPDSVAEPERAALVALPLPEPHRSLGPIPLRTALETLAGPAFRLVEDPVHRLVSFERCKLTLPVRQSATHDEAR
jgi:conjugative transfer region protein (TIGR03748 family)